MTFTVTSDPPLAKDCEHILTSSDGSRTTRRLKVENGCITFRKVRVEDSGEYTISCHNSKGEVGQATLELEVTPHPKLNNHQPLTSQTGKG